MKTLLRISVGAGMILMTSSLIACSDLVTRPQPEPVTVSTSTPPTSDPERAIRMSWAASLGPTSAPAGWRVFPCDNPVLLCVAADGALIGTVERFSLPLAELQLQTTTAPAEATDLEFLSAWVTDHYALIEHDRTIADNTLQFSAAPPVEVTVGGLPGLHYRFQVTHPDGRLFERMEGYVAIADETLHVFTTGTINGDPAGSFTNEADLQAFEPHLQQIIQELSL